MLLSIIVSMDHFDQVIWINIIKALDSTELQKKMVHSLMLVNKMYYTKMLKVFEYFKNNQQWRKWFTRIQTESHKYQYVYQGISSGFLDGIFLMFRKFSENPILVGEYSNNKETGEWKKYFLNGRLAKIKHYNNQGVKIGEHIEYSITGQIIRIQNFNQKGEYHGRQYEYSNKTELIEHYVNNCLHGKKIIKKNGIVVYECDIVNKLRHGDCIEYHENGQLLMKGSYYNGVPVGEHLLWWDNGKLSSITNYNVNGQVEGDIIEFNQKGVVKYYTKIKDGENV